MCKAIDSHCHLYDAVFDADRSEVCDRALEALHALVIVGDTVENSRAAVELCRQRSDFHTRLFAAAGVHPYHADGVNDAVLEALRELCTSVEVVAVGEIGLDFSHYSRVPADMQDRSLFAQLELALDCELPVIIHCRDGHERMMRHFKERPALFRRGVMHCFGGPPEFVEPCLEQGLYISFAGNVTFPKAETLRESARRVPLERLLIETDSPYLAPQPVRGKRCEPCYVLHTASCLAQVLQVSLDELIQQTTRNAETLFGLKRPV